MAKGKLFIISGPSGAGKGTISARVCADTGAYLSVSMTTRKPREGEVEGVSYLFVSKEKFLSLEDEGDFFETAEVYGEYYGTPKTPVLSALEEGRNVVLEIDTDGAMQAAAAICSAVTIFILPPSLKVLRQRIEGRASDTAEVIERRLSKALCEIEIMPKYDYCVINDDLETAIDDVLAVMRGEKAKTARVDAEKLVSKFEEESAM